MPVAPFDVLGHTGTALMMSASFSLHQKVWDIFSNMVMMGIDH